MEVGNNSLEKFSDEVSDVDENIEARDFYCHLAQERRYIRRELRELNHRIHQIDMINERDFDSDIEESNLRRFLRKNRDEEVNN